MKWTALIFKTLLAVFLVLCLSVHIYGLYAHVGNEGTQSHITHLLSYSLCLLAVLVKLRNRVVVYTFAAVYPFIYHANCAWVSFIDYGKPSWICLLVIVVMPMGALWVWTDSHNKLPAQ